MKCDFLNFLLSFKNGSMFFKITSKKKTSSIYLYNNNIVITAIRLKNIFTTAYVLAQINSIFFERFDKIRCVISYCSYKFRCTQTKFSVYFVDSFRYFFMIVPSWKGSCNCIWFSLETWIILFKKLNIIYILFIIINLSNFLNKIKKILTQWAVMPRILLFLDV